MTFPTGLIDQGMTQALAWALVHFVWQGALIGLAALAALRLFRFAPPTRYAIGVFALAAMAAAPVVTFGLLAGPTPLPVQPDAGRGSALAAPLRAEAVDALLPEEPSGLVGESSATAVVEGATSFAPVVLGIWLVGVIVLSFRLFGGWFVARRLTRRAVRPARAELQSLAQQIAGRLALDRVVKILESSAVAVPMLVGWLRPVVLIPASALSGLSPTQVEALLAHELAHIRRHDYLVNLLQSVVETLLFYHPAVWWVSREVCREREHCCDDLAVGVCDRLEYVTALANLAAMTAVPRPALAATDGSLVARVRRLLSPGVDGEASRTPGWVAASAIVVAVAGAAAFVPAADGSPGPVAQSPAVVRPVVTPAVSPPGPEQVLPAVAVPATVAPSVGAVPVGVPVAVPVAVAAQVPPPPPPPSRVVPPTPPPAPARVLPVPPTPDAPPAPPAPTQDPEKVRAVREAERELREVQREVEMKRLELEMQRAKIEAESQLESARGQMEILRRQIEKTRQMVDVGLATPEAQAALEKELAMAMQQLKMAESELTLRQSDIELRRREAMARAEYAERMAELQVAQRLAEVEARKAGEAAAIRDRHAIAEAGEAAVAVARATAVERALVAAEIEKRLAEARASARPDPDAMRFLEQQLAEMRGAVAASAAPLAADEPARAGDVLMLTIADEPGLPGRYTVQGDGTIRIPFVGGIRVQGMTAPQIRDTVARELTERNLKSNPSVAVTIRRPGR